MKFFSIILINDLLFLMLRRVYVVLWPNKYLLEKISIYMSSILNLKNNILSKSKRKKI